MSAGLVCCCYYTRLPQIDLRIAMEIGKLQRAHPCSVVRRMIIRYHARFRHARCFIRSHTIARWLCYLFVLFATLPHQSSLDNIAALKHPPHDTRIRASTWLPRTEGEWHFPISSSQASYLTSAAWPALEARLSGLREDCQQSFVESCGWIWTALCITRSF